MNDAKALLDSLMGPSRNKAGKEKKNDEFMERNVCKFYLVCWCPADWFDSTNRQQKPCTKLHSDHLKEQFEQHPDYKKHKILYEKEFLRHLEMMCAEADGWVEREKRKVKPAGKRVKIPVELKSQYDELEVEYAKLLEEAEKTASEAVMQQADAKKEQIDLLKKMHTIDFGGEEVCDVCGLRYPLVYDSNICSWSGIEHVQGKIHQGFQMIREKEEELRNRLRKQENNQENEKGDRSRSRRREEKAENENAEKKDDNDVDGKKEDKKDGRKDDRWDDRRDDRRDYRRRDRDNRKDDRYRRRDSPRRDERRGDDRGRRRRDDSRDSGRQRR